jgi:CMP-N,N'-diacetyllegionaminic acid synthase
MFNNKRILAVIPARGHHDTIEQLNMRELGGKPLIYYTFKAALQNKLIDKIIVSTEDNLIADYAKKEGIEPFIRDPSLTKENIDMIDILKNVVTHYQQNGETFDFIITLYPNAPFKTPELLTAFIEKISKTDDDVIIPVYGNKEFFWNKKNGQYVLILDKERHSRKDATTKYEERGGIYIYRKESLNKPTNNMKIGVHELDYHHSRMVNSIYDLYVLERLIRLPDKLLRDMQLFK